jgi:putative heme transporter
MGKSHTKRWKLVLTVVTFVALAALVYALRRQILETVANLGRVNTWALLLIVPAQMLNYHSLAKMYQGVFAVLSRKINYRFMLQTASELNFVNSVFPSGGVSGFSYFGVRMRAIGIAGGQATLVQMMRFVLVFISFQVLLSAGLLALAIGGKASGLVILIAGSLATLLAVMTLVAAYVIGSQRRINAFFTFLTKALNKLIQLVRPKNPETINIARVQKLFNDLHENYSLLKSKYR